MGLSKFAVEWTDENGRKQEERFNSYYLATLLKIKLTSQYPDVKIVEPVITSVNRTNLKYTATERSKYKKLFKEYSSKTNFNRKPYHSNFK